MCRVRPTVFLRNYYRKDFTLKLPSVKNKDKANRFSPGLFCLRVAHICECPQGARGIVRVTQWAPLEVRITRSEMTRGIQSASEVETKQKKTNWKREKTFHRLTLQGLISSNKVCTLAHKIREVLTSQEGTCERTGWLGRVADWQLSQEASST